MGHGRNESSLERQNTWIHLRYPKRSTDEAFWHKRQVAQIVCQSDSHENILNSASWWINLDARHSSFRLRYTTWLTNTEIFPLPPSKSHYTSANRSRWWKTNTLRFWSWWCFDRGKSLYSNSKYEPQRCFKNSSEITGEKHFNWTWQRDESKYKWRKVT